MKNGEVMMKRSDENNVDTNGKDSEQTQRKASFNQCSPEEMSRSSIIAAGQQIHPIRIISCLNFFKSCIVTWKNWIRVNRGHGASILPLYGELSPRSSCRAARGSIRSSPHEVDLSTTFVG